MKKTITIILLFVIVSMQAQKKELTLKDAVLGYYKGLYPKSLSGLKGVSNSDNFMYLEKDKWMIKNKLNQVVKSISLAELKKYFPELKHFPKVQYINDKVITFQEKNSKAMIVYNYQDKKIIKRISLPENAQNVDYNQGNFVAYTLDNNLYVAKKDDAKQKITAFDKNIVSGQAIHRFEFGISKGTFWSPKNNYLAFYQKDESNVSDYPLVDQTTYPASLKNIKYPMAGQASEQAKVGIYHPMYKELTYLKINTKDEHYLTNLSWTPDERYVLLAEVNREQNNMQYNMYDAKTGLKVKTLFEEKNDKWVEPEHTATFLPNSNDKFLWISERDGFNNLYLYNTKGKLIRQVTHFKSPIHKILGFDKKGKNVIVSATGKDARENQAFKVNIKKGTVIPLTTKKGTNRLQMQGNLLIANFSNLETPREISVIDVETTKETTIFSASNPLENYNIAKTEFVDLKSKDGYTLHGRMIKPANFDATKKYPVLLYVYGGPHAQLVTNSWLAGANLWMHWLANQKDYIVFTLDNRGSANRGFKFESIIHRKTGDAAIEDQLIGIDYLKKLNYIDSNRLAVFGWSYGGFMSTSLMLRHPGVFTTSVAGGPVTDWKYYEVMYGERYMDTPQENPKGYANARVGKYIQNLDGKMLIIHGSIDDTVVPQHSMTLLKEAVDKEVQVDFFTYPMHPHNVRGKDRVHLMTKVLEYVIDNNK